MIAAATLAQSGARTVRFPAGNTVREFIGDRLATGAAAPVAFLAEVPPGYTISPHFHRTDQFQLVVAGGGRLGKRPLTPWTVQYTDAETPYGPIVAGDEGLGFFTLRRRSSEGTFPMPASRADLGGKAGRTRIVRMDPSPRESRRLLREPDGLTVGQVVMAPNEVAALAPSRHGGTFAVVHSGMVRLDGDAYPPLSCMWVGEDDGAPRVQACDQGAVMMMFSFPPV